MKRPARYSHGRGRGVKDLNLEIPENCIYGYVGPNGSGKTTTIKMVCGLIAPTSGRAWVDGMEVLPKNSAKIKRLIGYLPDEFGVYEQMTVWEYLDFFGLYPGLVPEYGICDNAAHVIDEALAGFFKEEPVEVTPEPWMHDALVE